MGCGCSRATFLTPQVCVGVHACAHMSVVWEGEFLFGVGPQNNKQTEFVSTGGQRPTEK